MNHSEEKEFSMKLYFPGHFSMLQNMDFLDHIADAKRILFDKTLYAVCKDVQTAENIQISCTKLRMNKNTVKRVERLGPAFCSFKRKNDLKVLTIVKLPVNMRYDDLFLRFPGAVDICIKRTMAKLVFPDVAGCRDAYNASSDVLWPGSAAPKCKVATFEQPSEEEEEEEEPDSPDFLQYGHPYKFINNPCVVALTLKTRFELKSNMQLLNTLKLATDIVLSKSCAVTFDSQEETWERRQMLEGFDVMGDKLVVWVNRADMPKNSVSRTNEQLAETTVDEKKYQEEGKQSTVSKKRKTTMPLMDGMKKNKNKK